MTSPPNPRGWRGCSARPRRGATVALTTLGGWRNPLLGVCTAVRLVGCDAHCRAAASATLSINAAALALGTWAAGHSLLGVCTADRPVGCDARHRRCVGNALDQRSCSRSRKLELHVGLSPLGMCTADRRVGCDARRRGCVGNALDPRCYSRSRKLERHRPLAALSLGILSLDTSSLISLILSLDPRRRLRGEHVCRRLCELAAALGLRSPRIVHSRRSPTWFPFGSWAPRSPARALRSPAHHLGLVTRG